MMGLSDIRDLVSSLFIMLNKTEFILFRIEFLVVLVTFLFLAMFIMDIFRRFIHSSIMKAIFSLFDAVSDSIVIYLLGAMQTAPFKNQLLPVWALVLVTFRHNIDFISGYGVTDRGGRRFTEWRNVIKLLGTAFLNWTRGSKFERPLWTLWALQILRSWYRLKSHTLASNSVWHGNSSELVSEYMRAVHGPNKWENEDCDPKEMDGYKYLVYGERVQLRKKPRYVLNIDSSSNIYAQDDMTSPKTTTKSSLITLDKIWKCRGHLLNADDDHNRSKDRNQGNDLVRNSPLACLLSRILRCSICCHNKKDKTRGNEQKDLCMAFALSRLLRCRFEDVMLPKDMYFINRELIKTKIIEEQDAKRAFRVMELQLAYVNDYFNTRYPMVFWWGLRSLGINLLQSVVTIGVVLWLSIDIRRVYKPPDGELAHLVQEVNVDIIITWVFMFFMTFKEILEMVTYLLSDWTRLLLVCMYVKWEGGHFMTRCMEKTILSFFASKITDKRWHGLLDQYVFMQSYDDRPKVWNWFHTVTTGLVPKKEDGAKLGSAHPVPDCVLSNIREKLNVILEQAISEKPTVNPDINSDDEQTYRLSLPGSINALSETNMRYDWALQLETSSEIILVWHIATSFCEMELANNYNVDLSNPGFLSSILACFTSCCSSKYYLIDVDERNEGEANGNHSSNSCFKCSFLLRFSSCFSSKSTKKKLSGELKERYIVANSLSRYCAYLLVSKPDLIPDSFLVPQMVFKKSVKNARNILRSCDSLYSRYNKLSLEAYKAAEDPRSVIAGEEVVKQGALLGKQLLDQPDKGCWRILADVWTELIIHIAPTWNAEAHKNCLESGGEFITIIWALLWHCGIEKSKLWQEDDASENNATTDIHASDAGNNINNAGIDTTNHQTRSNVPEMEEDIETGAGQENAPKRVK
ncbi:hypothetical protein HU200_002814 [Digitaria exilis]|uniref:DUF4220 domain-containing protein n=1 Tax=Digitaria exilis TaxID=1010633 RepID=A0A835KTJ0_9POAL|nr:hypothetical protein HU200_002814 [Digitaria exilis]